MEVSCRGEEDRWVGRRGEVEGAGSEQEEVVKCRFWVEVGVGSAVQAVYRPQASCLAVS